MKMNIFEVLMDLIDNFIKNESVSSDMDAILDRLSEMGMNQATIDEILDKLEPIYLVAPKANSHRYFSAEETEKISSEALTYLVFIEQCGLIDTEQREIILLYALDADVPEIDINHIKFITTMVVTQHLDGRDAAWVEFLLHPERYRQPVLH